MLAAASAYGQSTFDRAYRSGGLTSDLNEGVDVEQTVDGGYVIAGVQEHLGGGQRDLYLIRTDANGDTVWTRTFGGDKDDYAQDVDQTMDGGFIVVGNREDIGTGQKDPYLVRTDMNGDTIWTRTYAGPCNLTGMWVDQTFDGGYIIGGGTCDSTGHGAVLLLRTDANGDTVWSKVLQYPDLGPGVFGAFSRSGHQTADEGFILCGKLSIPSGSYILLIKTDAFGNPTWTRGYGGFYSITGFTIETTSDGGYAASGSFLNGFTSFKALLVKTDAIGDTLWTRIYSTSDRANAMEGTFDGGYFFTSYQHLVKLDVNGDILWNTRFGGTAGFTGSKAHQTSDSGFIYVGSTGSPDRIRLIKTDAYGQNGCNDPAFNIGPLNDPLNVISPLIVSTPAHITVGPYTTIVASGGMVDSECTAIGMNEGDQRTELVIFPDPCSGSFEVNFGSFIDRGSIRVVDALGACIFEEKVSNEQHKSIELTNIGSGVYLVILVSGGRVNIGKVLIQ